VLSTFRQPGWHIAFGRDFRDLFGALLHVGVAKQGERPRLTRTMAPGAMRKDQRGNIFVKGYGSVCGYDETADEQNK
jgi:hypothetical protein